MQLTAKLAHPTGVLSAADLSKLLDMKDREIAHLRRQMAWFQRLIFGQKSERCSSEPEGIQGTLGGSFEIVPADLPAPKKSSIAAHEREHKNKNQIDSSDDTSLFFDDPKVPVEIIVVPNPAAAGLEPADYEAIVSGNGAEKVLAARHDVGLRKYLSTKVIDAVSKAPRQVGLVKNTSPRTAVVYLHFSPIRNSHGDS